MIETVLGVIGGSGLSTMSCFKQGSWRRVESPWGQASDDFLHCEIDGLRVVFLPRHGRRHRIPPSDIDYRANIDGLKRCGVTDVISLSACGALRPDLPIGSFVLADQYIDRTHGRAGSFFGEGMVVHVSMADPVSPALLDLIEKAAAAEKISVIRGGVYVVIEGPQFSTRAESKLYRQWGGDVIGMTNYPEARLVREAEMSYASICMVTDHDCGAHDKDEPVDVAKVVAALTDNADRVTRLMERLIRLTPKTRPIDPVSDRALECAVITPPEARDRKRLDMVSAIAKRIL